jgi:hypothetical protein
VTELRVQWGYGWGDEVCDWCGAPADGILHLTWPDGVDENYAQACFAHTQQLTDNLWDAYQRRRGRPVDQ